MVAIFSWLLVSAAWFLIAATAFARPGNFGPFWNVPLLAESFVLPAILASAYKNQACELSAVMLGMQLHVRAAIGPESLTEYSQPLA